MLDEERILMCNVESRRAFSSYSLVTQEYDRCWFSLTSQIESSCRVIVVSYVLEAAVDVILQ